MKYKNVMLKICSMVLVACLSFGSMTVFANPTENVDEVEEENTEAEEIVFPEDAIYLSNAEDIVVLAENCVFDTWSVGKTVVLNNDIDMSDVEFMGIPTFGGAFYGQGYTISGVYMEQDASVVGFFRYLQKDAVVDNLKIEAEIEPEGTSKIVGGFVGNNAGTIKNCVFTGSVNGKEQIGGIAGLNRAMGIIENCIVNGEVYGNHYIGGIVGKNKGVIRQCTNQAKVNTTSSQNTIGLSLDGGMDVSSLTSKESMDSATNIGGIAGTSSGVIRECINQEKVGYTKMGYNVGGIVGSQNGYLVDCINYADVDGSNGVGGIVGQFKPNIVLDFGTNPMNTMSSSMNSMMSSMEKIVDKMEGMDSASLEDSVNFDDDAKNIEDALEAIKNAGKNEDGEVDEDALNAALNDLSASFEKAYDDTSAEAGVGEEATNVSDEMENMMKQMENIMNSVSSMSSMSMEIKDVSRKDTEKNTIAKAYNCVNYGKVAGETYVAGIAGIANTENIIDMEEDIETRGEIGMDSSAEMRLVIRECKNYGTVGANKECVGGIVGYMSIGAVFNGYNVGNVDALSADCVGGIAGNCETVIFESYSKCAISGADYVGGIAGYAVEVLDSYAVVDIAAATEFAGTVIGGTENLPDIDKDLIEGNFYYIVGKDIGGIDGVSYEGVTDKITLEDYLALENLDDMFKTVSVRFVAEDQDDIVMTVGLGKSIDYEDIPTLTVAETDMYDWVLEKPVTYEVLAMGEEEEIIYASDARLSNLLFDQTYEASFERKNMVSQSEQKTEDNKSIVLAIGAFEKNTTVELKDVLAGEAVVSGDDVFENWEVLISNRGIEKLHYRIPAGKDAEALRLYIKNNTGSWEERDFTVEGSFMIFDFTAGDSGFALAEKFVVNPIVVIAIAVVAIVGIGIYMKKKGLKIQFKKKDTKEIVEE